MYYSLNFNFKIFRDGTLVSSSLLENFAWAPNYPNESNPNATCIHWTTMGQMVNTGCDETADESTNYYSGTTDTSLLTGPPTFTGDHLHRGYMCEARILHTTTGNDLCIFPFRYSLFSISLSMKILSLQ